MMEGIALDPKAFEQLMVGLLTEIKKHYGRSEVSQKSVCEALNALACATAVVLAGSADTGSGELALEFFHNALSSQLNAPIPGEQTRGH